MNQSIKIHLCALGLLWVVSANQLEIQTTINSKQKKNAESSPVEAKEKQISKRGRPRSKTTTAATGEEITDGEEIQGDQEDEKEVKIDPNSRLSILYRKFITFRRLKPTLFQFIDLFN